MKRVATISNELRIVSGIHGLFLKRMRWKDFWTDLIYEIRDDEILGSKAIHIIEPSDEMLGYEVWIEPTAFTRSVYYVLKEGLDALDTQTKAELSLSLHNTPDGRSQFHIRVRAAEGLKCVPPAEWLELKFCEYLLGRYRVTVSIQISPQELVLVIGLPPDARLAGISSLAV